MQAVAQTDFKPDYRVWLPLSACAVILLAWHLWAYFTLTTLIFALLLSTIIIYALFHCARGMGLRSFSFEIESGTTFEFYQVGTTRFTELKKRIHTLSLGDAH